MLLKYLKLKDFRQFKGEQAILFAKDSKKNVTVIMGENASGKTTLAQAFTWCLYSSTDFDDPVMLCKATSQAMRTDAREKVKVEICFEHSGIEYYVIREQEYLKLSNGNLKAFNVIFKIAYKAKDGQLEFIKDIETELRMKEILPMELSRYFFFDGERIVNMGREIRKGRSQEFAKAVKGLLGLSAISAALDHLKGRSKTSVIRRYDEIYDSDSNSKIANYSKEIEEHDDKIYNIDKELEQLDKEESIAQDKCKNLNDKIAKNAESSKLAEEKKQLSQQLTELTQSKKSTTTSFLKSFNNNASSYFAKKLINDALQMLSDADKLDKGIPDIHARTIDFLIKRGNCICGNKIETGNNAYIELNKVKEYIPPQAIGSAIGQFVRECELKVNHVDSYFDDLSDKYKMIRNCDTSYNKIQNNIQIITDRLKGMEKIGELQKDVNMYEKRIREIRDERDTLNNEKGRHEENRGRIIQKRDELNLKEKHNKNIEVYKAYAQYMFNVLDELYKIKESEIRSELEKNINEIFKNIYNGGLSLSIDEKYNVQVIVNDNVGYDDDIETSTAQNISIIFAFISGVIKMARQSNNDNENEILVSEPYPLVMDAPLSAFDKTRIKTVCDTLPKIAEQVIIFIKDTDGEIAEENLGKKIGMKYIFNKKNEFETYLQER